MASRTIDECQRKAARVAGAAFLLAIAVVVAANYGINFRLIVPGDAAQTARNILAHETLFRLNIACNLIYVAILLVLVAALYVVLKPAGRVAAPVAALARLVSALMWGTTALNSLGALRLLGPAAHLAAFGSDQVQALARLNLSASYDAYYVGLPFWALASTIWSGLLFKSRYVPRALAAFGVISSVWGAACALAFIVFPHFDAVVGASWFDLPMLLFELALGLWLLLKGLPPTGPADVGGA